ncbi:MAG: AGE family epimerase/isomerase [Calditrichaeota bacterium]|nr:AGE family epimerase/isomerase [candidate division KSB1 bacterium]MCB0282642.1 AGE family epimerase/isomerase [Calditrichota bacterium]
MTYDKNYFLSLKKQFEQELFESVLPFWEKHSPDKKNGGYFNCLDRDGSVYDSTKHVWLQGRQVWMFSKLYREVQQRPEWLDLAASGMKFLRQHAITPQGRVHFTLTADGKALYTQRKIFSECFYTLALNEYAIASGQTDLQQEALQEFEKIWEFSQDASLVGRPSTPGDPGFKTLAIPMIMLNLMEELSGDNHSKFQTEVDTCLAQIKKHVIDQTVYENISPDGGIVNTSAGRLLNPGHAIEAGWFLQHWAIRLKDDQLSELATNIVRWSFDKGWDKKYGGIIHFLDGGGYNPVQLEWDMKLWWPHCEALYAHLLNYFTHSDDADLQRFKQTYDYTFKHFPDKEHGEWFGYLNRSGEVTHRFKGGPYKGCFHVPRTLWLCHKLISEKVDDL